MPTKLDNAFMRRAIALAMRGRGGAEPNPMVGCVIARGDRIIGEGYHARRGGAHAEPTALAACIESTAGATAYVTLEPCCHTNKLTPPCAPRLIAAGIARVVIGCLDPSAAVNGNGVRMLREAGIIVDGPVLEESCKQLIAAFIKRINGRGPYLTMKWAQSADGKVAGPGGVRTQISGPEANRAVHELRGRCDGICVGIGTVLMDDPLLLPRNVPVLRVPRRLVLDTNLRLPLASKLVQTAREHPVEVFCRPGHPRAAHADALRAAGVNVRDNVDNDETNRLSMSEVMGDWERLELSNVLIEAGPTLALACLPSVDRLWVIRSSRAINDPTSPKAAIIPASFQKVGEVSLGDDLLTEYLNAPCALDTSADFAAALGMA